MEREIKMTREEYLNTKSLFALNTLEDQKFKHQLHVEYYSQFITNGTKFIAERVIKENSKYLSRNFRQKINESLNGIQLQYWDAEANRLSDLNYNARAWKECEYQEWHKANKEMISISLSDRLSFLKCAARIVLKEKGWKETKWDIGNVYWLKRNELKGDSPFFLSLINSHLT